MSNSIEKIACSDMSRTEWLAERRKSIGGSDAGIILGLSPYRSCYNLWLEKTGTLIPEDISDKESVRLGNDLEEYVAKRFTGATGKKVRKTNYIYRNSDYPFAHANPDRLIVGEDAGLECKTTSSYEVLEECKKGFPTRWYAQCVHYMMTMGPQYKKWYLAVLVFGRGFFWFELDRDEAEIAALAEAEKSFWDMVERDEAPALDGSASTAEAIRACYPESDGSTVDLTAVSDSLIIYDAIGRQIKELTAQQEEKKNEIMAFMGSADTGLYAGYKVTLKSQSRESFDKKRFGADHPELLAEYTTTGGTRVFRFMRKDK